VLLPVSYLYNDFFAAVVNDEGGVEPIWTPEDFVACLDYVSFAMAEESGSEYEISLTGDLDAGLIRSEQPVADSDPYIMDYVIKDGLIVEVTTTFGESITKVSIEYGIPSETDIESFREAIDLWLAGQ
jgi:hypothetical protein